MSDIRRHYSGQCPGVNERSLCALSCHTDRKTDRQIETLRYCIILWLSVLRLTLYRALISLHFVAKFALISEVLGVVSTGEDNALYDRVPSGDDVAGEVIRMDTCFLDNLSPLIARAPASKCMH